MTLFYCRSMSLLYRSCSMMPSFALLSSTSFCIFAISWLRCWVMATVISWLILFVCCLTLSISLCLSSRARSFSYLTSWRFCCWVRFIFRSNSSSRSTSVTLSACYLNFYSRFRMTSSFSCLCASNDCILRSASLSFFSVALRWLTCSSCCAFIIWRMRS